MIYLRPVGGLCNRMRTVDSFFSICKELKKDLTIIWTLDETLNCSFFELFETPVISGFNLTILDCPRGFPETNLVKLGKREDKTFKINTEKKDGYLKAKLKAIAIKKELNKEQKGVAAKINAISFNRIITNEELGDIYNSSGHLNLTTSEMDAVFVPKARSLFQEQFAGKDDVYIACCFRMYPLENSYAAFIPLKGLASKIAEITKKYDLHTLGLHIRKTDHTVAKSASTTEKFIAVIDEGLQKNSETNFFLSTDDVKTKEELIDSYGSKIITQDLTSYSRNDAQAIKEAVVDLYCLSKTNHICGSHHSSFSQTAADIGGINEKTVI